MTAFQNEPRLHQARRIPAATCSTFVRHIPRSLEQAVHAAVCALGDDQLKPLTDDDVGPFSQTRALLALMTHCYARQLYSSLDLTDIARRDRDFARLGGEGFPKAGDIRRLRTENRDAVHRCLVRALHFLVEQKISLGILTKVNDTQLAEEASRRIIMATFLDSLELDGEPVTDPPVEISYLFANRPAPGH